MSPRTKAQFDEIREQTVEKIFDSALRLFGTLGYKSTGIAAIAKEAKVSKGLLYHYFISKEDLLVQLVNSLMDKYTQETQEMDISDPKETLKSLFQMFFREVRQNKQQWRLMTNLAIEVNELSFIRDLAIQKLSSYLVLFEEVFHELEYTDPAGEACLLAALFDGIGIQYYVFDDDAHLKQLENALVTKYCK
ncbi:MAG: AcrR family transcriptional regulator [Cyclobacteriaceae bacterium]|jgi:AcrR family transcriptional regulator